MCIGAFKGHFFVKAILKRIQISKQIMTLDLQQGVEIFIPKDLQQNDLSCSFRYYDSIL